MSKESAIFDQLPFDIVSTIFSFVHQADVLTCMAVCRAWYDRVPQYTEKLWRTIHITSPDVLTASYRRDRCLGSHVKSVVFETVPEEQLYSTMRKLVELGCDGIETLGKNKFY
ncbi:hypothetical protein BDB00DRAFT_325222 [Zychaea mexicana]|uniref:uncharacterized protein n=1 Tax=Zychaea mexicana TaxID=64656 RepID=UPI0022FEE10D|nr:uncharacterized protein BDB00DRAFT_325222 [Zychaea mexicana]KAI9498903.1 hypothetical protein BDB00DRAFT_325222 [Zychaea mexicana]